MNQRINWPVVKLATASVVGHVCLLLVIALHVKKSNVDFTSPTQRPVKIVQASLIAFQLPRTNKKQVSAVDKKVEPEDEQRKKIESKQQPITDKKVSKKSTIDKKRDDKETIVKELPDKVLLKTAKNKIDMKSQKIAVKASTPSASSILKASRQLVNQQKIQHPSFTHQHAKAGMSVMDKPLPVHHYQEIIVDEDKERLVVVTCDSAASKVALMASFLLNGTLRCQPRPDLMKYIEARRLRKPQKTVK
ncbi:MAG: hypothetical protein HRU25_10730 [Psychrobium sp.]|nr:hypothetical protein [Psychrobium sp.]